ncbi:MAG: hypothetical protein QOG79_5316 [Mycobacterium sp.]|nr:hypothetical protein [Pseudonocardiales bacterium]MDT5084475.1 hypothetical protein [Mycobacterium sp.]MDT5194599.1 hypothetical protein [Mycobacterium sp.]MDT5239484.1 hypothetical protein [Mycobacterium sp.]MDT5288411.1 hypothetical protein [Mycobacterium sp.]
MSTTELGEVEALLERVLPDPRGFAERVFDQLMQRLTMQVPDAAAPVVDSYDAAAYQALVDRNMILAAAVGACDCWGFESGCAECGGLGVAGWIKPDAGLYGELVEPAIKRMAEMVGDEATQTTDHSTEGERA